jgi:hypothetical protein
MSKHHFLFNWFMHKILILTLFLLASCGILQEKKAEQQNPKKPQLVHSIVFVDKSVSVKPDKKFISDKYKGIFKEIVNQNIHGKGDKLDIYYIHENTAKARVFSLTSKASIVAEDTLNANPTDVAMVKNKFDMDLRKERNAFFKKGEETLTFSNQSASNQNTDIWASLDVLNKLVKTDENRLVKVYFLSDMVESMTQNGRRDFHINPPKDNSQAEIWAKEDLTVLQQRLDLEKFTNLHINIALPFEPTTTRKENNPAIIHYWETLFSLLGVEENIEEL